jgi:hypothetical protein
VVNPLLFDVVLGFGSPTSTFGRVALEANDSNVRLSGCPVLCVQRVTGQAIVKFATVEAFDHRSYDRTSTDITCPWFVAPYLVVNLYSLKWRLHSCLLCSGVFADI